MFAPASTVHETLSVRDAPLVSLTNIQTVNAAEFKPYVLHVGVLYNQLQRLKESGNEVSVRRGREPKKPRLI